MDSNYNDHYEENHISALVVVAKDENIHPVFVVVADNDEVYVRPCDFRYIVDLSRVRIDEPAVTVLV